MKISVLIYTNDRKYIDMLAVYYQQHYGQLDIYDVHLFSEQKKAEEYLEQYLIDVLLIDEHSDLDISKYEDSLCAYLTANNAINTLKNIKAIGKYQKFAKIFQEIFDYFAEENQKGVDYKFSKGQSKVLLFYHAAGGVGCTTAAAACAMFLAEKKAKKVLYLNMELGGITELYFEGDVQKDFSEVVYIVGSRTENLAMKLMACTALDRTGVRFIKSSQNVLDFLELSGEDVELLLHTLKNDCDFDYIVIDADSGMQEINQIMIREAEKIVFVSEISEISFQKYKRCKEGICLLDSLNKTKHASKIMLLYNKYRRGEKTFPVSEKVLGGIPLYQDLSSSAVAKAISQTNVFESL